MAYNFVRFVWQSHDVSVVRWDKAALKCQTNSNASTVFFYCLLLKGRLSRIWSLTSLWAVATLVRCGMDPQDSGLNVCRRIHDSQRGVCTYHHISINLCTNLYVLRTFTRPVLVVTQRSRMTTTITIYYLAIPGPSNDVRFWSQFCFYFLLVKIEGLEIDSPEKSMYLSILVLISFGG